MSEKTDKFNVPQVRFAGEPDGVSEREFKAKLGSLFDQRQNVEKAFLPLVNYGDPNVYHVAVALGTRGGPDEALVREVSAVFASLFGSDQHLDISFIRDEQEAQISNVCKPFFTRD